MTSEFPPRLKTLSSIRTQIILGFGLILGLTLITIGLVLLIVVAIGFFGGYTPG